MTILKISRSSQVFSLGILRFVGYSLLLLAVIDLLWLLIPVQLMNPLWELQTMGAIIDKIPFTLLGLILILSGQKSDRAAIEAVILKVLSWASLVTAVALLFAIPVNINNIWQIYHQHDDTANAQLVEQQDRLQQFKEQLAAANSQDEIAAILAQQARQTVNIPQLVNIQKLKTDIIANLQNNQDNITSQAQAFREQKRSWLLKQCFKWNLGAIISAVLFLMIWQSTQWARFSITSLLKSHSSNT